MKSIEITKERDLKPFDCGDADLNGFLVDDAIAFHDKHIGTPTYLPYPSTKRMVLDFLMQKIITNILA